MSESISEKLNLTTLKSSFWRYLPKMNREENKDKPMVYLFEFAGAIGSGKTATAEAVSELIDECGIRKNYVVINIFEDIVDDDNKKAIEDFYASGSQDDGELENTICSKRIRTLISALNVALNCDQKTIIISDRSVEEDIVFINKLLTKHKEDSDQEISDKLYTIRTNIETFLSDINEFKSRVIHKIIYLDPGLDNAIKRIRHRGRPSEQQISYELLDTLTIGPKGFSKGDVHIIENANFDIKETALMAYERIIWELSTPNEIHHLPLHKMLVSFYGVPGSGKTHFLKELETKLSQFSFKNGCDPDFDAVVKDESDEADIVEAQRKVYESDDNPMSPDKMQSWIDKRRIADFEACKDDHFCAFTFTDVGPLTSVVFRNSTDCVNKNENNHYAKWFVNADGGDFDIFVNVVVEPTEGLSEVRRHIKDRGRPGEYEYFTEEKLDQIQELIREQINKQPNGTPEEYDGTYHAMVVCENDYSNASVDKMFHAVMETIRNAVIGYSASR
jgi:deoxyadenosine/deoxycytidine kinase